MASCGFSRTFSRNSTSASGYFFWDHAAYYGSFWEKMAALMTLTDSTVYFTTNYVGGDVNAVMAEMEPTLPPGYRFQVEGQNKDMQESIHYASIAIVLAVLFIYMVLASQFNSFVHPLTIMTALPLSLPAGLLALMAFGVGLMTKFLIIPFMAAYDWHRFDRKNLKSLGPIAVDTAISLATAVPASAHVEVPVARRFGVHSAMPMSQALRLYLQFPAPRTPCLSQTFLGQAPAGMKLQQGGEGIGKTSRAVMRSSQAEGFLEAMAGDNPGKHRQVTLISRVQQRTNTR